jgi:hypothetical protein
VIVMSALHTRIAGIPIPDSTIAREATEFVQTSRHRCCSTTRGVCSSEHERFEIDGANAARDFLERHGLSEEHVMTVWDAIALHTTREVPPLQAAGAPAGELGVEYDSPGRHFDELTADVVHRSRYAT